MAEWKKDYYQKHMTAEKAIQNIQSGMRVVVGHAAGEPSVLINELIAGVGLEAQIGEPINTLSY